MDDGLDPIEGPAGDYHWIPANNLTAVEENFLQNSLYELRMAYVEVTNALARPPKPGPAAGAGVR